MKNDELKLKNKIKNEESDLISGHNQMTFESLSFHFFRRPLLNIKEIFMDL